MSAVTAFKRDMSGADIFHRWISHILLHEGNDKLTNDPDDPGGATVWGWSLRALKSLGDLDGDGFPDGDIDHDGDIDYQDVVKLRGNRAQAVEMYYNHFWSKYSMFRFAEPVAVKLLDLGVNQGVKQASKELQRACRAVSGVPLMDDGILGNQSTAVINNCDPIALTAAFSSEAAGFYRVLVAQKPVMAKYQNGWLTRAYWRTF